MLIRCDLQRYTGFECEKTYDDDGNPSRVTNPTKRAISATSEGQIMAGEGDLTTGNGGSEQDNARELAENIIAMPLGGEREPSVQGPRRQQQTPPQPPPAEEPDTGYHCHAAWLRTQGVSPRLPRPPRVRPQISTPDEGTGDSDYPGQGSDTDNQGLND